MSLVVDFSKYSLEELYSAKWSILEGRYAIMAMFCLQIYEWISKYVCHFDEPGNV